MSNPTVAKLAEVIRDLSHSTAYFKLYGRPRIRTRVYEHDVVDGPPQQGFCDKRFGIHNGAG